MNRVIHASNPDAALYTAIQRLMDKESIVLEQQTRNGAVSRFVGPMITAFDPMPVHAGRAMYRVSMNRVRDANPFFHFMEAMWMLAGANDIDFVAFFNKRMREYSDDGKTQPAAYGHRWRRHFETDQLVQAVAELRANPSSRRVVINMYDPRFDGQSRMNGGKDVPCNTTVFFSTHDGVLDMTVSNRSNDMVWGAYGANVVHFSFLHEFVACAVGLNVGTYYQVSNDLHIYTEVFTPEWMARYCTEFEKMNVVYVAGDPVLSEKDKWGEWLHECEEFVISCRELIYYYEKRPVPPAISPLRMQLRASFTQPWFRHTAIPLFLSWLMYVYARRNRDDANLYHMYSETAAQILRDAGNMSPDWRLAGSAWLLHKKAAYMAQRTAQA